MQAKDVVRQKEMGPNLLLYHRLGREHFNSPVIFGLRYQDFVHKVMTCDDQLTLGRAVAVAKYITLHLGKLE